MALDTVKNTLPCPAPAQGPGVESAHPPAGVGVHHVGVEAVVGEVQHPAQQEEAPAQSQQHRHVVPGQIVRQPSPFEHWLFTWLEGDASH